MTEIVVVIIIVAILVALGFGLIGMVKGGREGSDKMFKSLVTRVTLSVFVVSVGVVFRLHGLD